MSLDDCSVTIDIDIRIYRTLVHIVKHNSKIPRNSFSNPLCNYHSEFCLSCFIFHAFIICANVHLNIYLILLSFEQKYYHTVLHLLKLLFIFTIQPCSMYRCSCSLFMLLCKNTILCSPVP